jgi:glycosyltransferase involved in cell wall biosynthesis
MRVLVVTNLHPPYCIGGYERLAGWAAEGLTALGHEVSVLTGRADALAGRPGLHPDLDLDQPAIVEMSRGAGISFPAGLRAAVRRHVWSGANYHACARRIDRTRPELASFWNLAFLSPAPLLAARRRGVPVVLHVSDAALNPFRGVHPPAFPGAARAVARTLVDLLHRKARPARLVFPSAFLRDRLLRGESLPPERASVLHWPIPPDVEAVDPPRRPGSPRRLLFVGSLIPEKGPQVLIEAFRSACLARPGLSLTLVGEGPRAFGERLRSAAAGLPVRFEGRLERAQVIEAYRSHDVLAFPSTWDEPFALVPLEAMALGLAVVATRSGGTGEAVLDGETGVLVPAGDAGALSRAIVDLSDAPDRARALSGAGQRHARSRHAFAAFLRHLEALYLECAARAPS